MTDQDFSVKGNIDLSVTGSDVATKSLVSISTAASDAKSNVAAIGIPVEIIKDQAKEASNSLKGLADTAGYISENSKQPVVDFDDGIKRIVSSSKNAQIELNKLSIPSDKIKAEAEDAADQIGELAKKAAEPIIQRSLQNQASSTGRFSIEGALRSTASLTGGRTSELGNVLEEVSKIRQLADSISILGAAAGPVAVIIAAVGAAINLFSDSAAKAAQAAKDAADKQIKAIEDEQKVREAGRTAASDTLKVQIADTQKQISEVAGNITKSINDKVAQLAAALNSPFAPAGSGAEEQFKKWQEIQQVFAGTDLGAQADIAKKYAELFKMLPGGEEYGNKLKALGENLKLQQAQYDAALNREKTVDTVKAEQLAEKAAAEFAKTATSEQLTARLKAIEDEKAGINSAIDKLKAQTDATGAAGIAIDAYNKSLRDLNVQEKALNDVAAAAIKKAEDQKNQGLSLINTTEAAIKAEQEKAATEKLTSEQIKEKIKQNEKDVQMYERLRQQLIDSGVDTKDVTQKIADYKVKIEQLKGSTDNLNEVLNTTVKLREAEAAAAEEAKNQLDAWIKNAAEYEKNLSDITKLDETYTKTLSKRAQDDARNSQIADYTKRINDAKETERIQASTDKINQLKAQAEQANIDSEKKAKDSRAKLDSEYMKLELKAWADYRDQEARATRDHNIQRIRQLQDLYDTLSGLAAKGDVAGFVAAAKQGTKSLNRSDEDFATKKDDAWQNFKKQRDVAKEHYNQQLADLQAALRTERDNRAKQLQTQIDQEKKAAEVRISQSAKLEKELSDLKARWAEQDKANARDQEDKAFRDQVAALQLRNDVLKPYIQAPVKAFAEAAKNALIDINNLLKGIKQNQRVDGTGKPVHFYATGSLYIPEDTIAEVHKGEKITPASQNGQSDYQGIYVDLRGATFGDIASMAAVKIELAAMGNAILNGIKGGALAVR